MRISEDELDKRFNYHAPMEHTRSGSTQVERYTAFRAESRKLAGKIIEFSLASREQSLALTKLEEAVMWFNAAIARNEQ